MLTKGMVEGAPLGAVLWENYRHVPKRGEGPVKGFGVRVAPGGTRTFVYRYRNASGRQHLVKVANYPDRTVEQARAIAKEYLEAVKRGEDPAASKREKRDAPTLSALADVYLGEYAQSAALRPSTVSNARYLLAAVRPTLGKLKVRDVTIADIRAAHGRIRLEGERAGKAGVYTANRLLAVLSKMFEIAVEREWRTDNPCKRIKRFEEQQRGTHLDDAEVGRLLNACALYEAGQRPGVEGKAGDPGQSRPPIPESEWNANDREAADAVRLLLFTGARLREVLNSEWGQFDMEAGLWEKPSSHTKTKRQHRLELEGPALDLLRAMKKRARHPVYLFPGNPELRRKDAPLDIRTGQPKGIAPRADLKRPWQTICALAGLEGVRIHDLRRTLASFMLSGGASLPTVGNALGHTQPATTARYAHLDRRVQRNATRAAGERMAALQGQSNGATVHSIGGVGLGR